MFSIYKWALPHSISTTRFFDYSIISTLLMWNNSHTAMKTASIWIKLQTLCYHWNITAYTENTCSSSRDVASALHLFLSNPLHSQVNLIFFPSFSKAAHLFIVANATITQNVFPWTLLDKSYLHNCKIAFPVTPTTCQQAIGTPALPTGNIPAHTTLSVDL